MRLVQVAATVFCLTHLPSDANADDIGSMQMGVTANQGMSVSRCASHAHAICRNVVGGCSEGNDFAVGRKPGIMIALQCFPLERGVVVMAISGAHTENASGSTMSRLVRDAYNRAYRRLN